MLNNDDLFKLTLQTRKIVIVERDVELLKKLGREILASFPNYEVFATDNIEDAEIEIEKQKAIVMIVELPNTDNNHYLDFMKKLALKKGDETCSIIALGSRDILEKQADFLESLHINVVPKAIRIPFFISVVRSTLKEAQDVHFETIELEAGAHLFREGETSSSIYILQSGSLQVYKEKEGKSFDIATIRPVQLVGEMAFIEDSPRSASIKAIENCQLIELRLVNLGQFFSNQPFWLKLMIENLITRLKETNQKVVVEN